MDVVLGAAGIPGILVLAWINGIMALLRRFAGAAVHRLAPTGILLGSAIASGLGLLWLSYAETTAMAFVSGTLFALGVSYFWPTMLGVVAERVPRGGALALAVMGGTGALTVGAVTTPWMGAYVDQTGHEKLDPAATASVLRVAAEEFSLKARIAPGGLAHDLEVAVGEVREVLGEVEKSGGALPPIKTANALRKVILLGGNSDVARNARAILEPAESYGGRRSFRAVALLAIVLTAVFGVLYLSDRLRGGYRPEALLKKGPGPA
jgi:hypothetical protein